MFYFVSIVVLAFRSLILLFSKSDKTPPHLFFLGLLSVSSNLLFSILQYSRFSFLVFFRSGLLLPSFCRFYIFFCLNLLILTGAQIIKSSNSLSLGQLLVLALCWIEMFPPSSLYIFFWFTFIYFFQQLNTSFNSFVLLAILTTIASLPRFTFFLLFLPTHI